MLTISVTALLLFCAVPPAATQVSTTYVDIDGSKHPEQVPEWVTWQTAFSTLSLAERSASKAVPESLEMSDADKQLVFAAASQQAARDAACQKKVDALKPLLGKTEASVINQRTHEIQLECRQRTLDAAESLMKALSPEGQTGITAWLQTIKAGIHVSVPKDELDHFHRPY